MKTSKMYSVGLLPPSEGKDYYQLAEEWGITFAQVGERLESEGWLSVGYNPNTGQEEYVPPEIEATY